MGLLNRVVGDMILEILKPGKTMSFEAIASKIRDRDQRVTSTKASQAIWYLANYGEVDITNDYKVKRSKRTK